MSTTYRGGAFTGGDEMSRFLIDLAAGRAERLDTSVPAGLVQLAQRHGLIPLLSQVTDDRLVRAISARETSRSRVLKHHLERILTSFQDKGVRVSVLKGPAIAMRYQDPDLRPFTDIDLLVPRSEVEAAIEVLSEEDAAIHVPEKRPKADKRDVLFGDATGMHFNVDLHWDLFSYSQLRGSADGATEAAWTEAVMDEDSPLGPVWDIPDAYRLAFLAAHAVLDHRFRLILFRDFHELGRLGVDWDEVVEVALQWDLRSTTYLALWLARETLGVPVPDGVLSSLRPPSFPVRVLEWSLPRVDVVRFDGHRPHPVNLAAVLLNDSPRQRLSLAFRAPAAFPRWRQRVADEHHHSDSPRTLILASTDRRRGAEVFSERLRDGLTARGWVAEAVCLRSYGEEPVADLEPLIASGTGHGGRFDATIARALRRKIRSFRPDVVVANGGATLRYAIAARLGGGFKLVYVGIGEPQYWLRSKVSRWLNRFMLRRVDHVLAVSEATREQLTGLERSLSRRISTTYTGVPDELFRLHKSVSNGPLHILMVGSLTPEKDPGRALRATVAIPDAQLRFVGTGPLMDDLIREARSLDAGDRVEFTGSVIDVTPHLEWADALVLTSLSEGLPGAILEAGAAGVPTVAVDVGGVREAVIDGKTGFVTGPDIEELVRAMKALDADRGLLHRMGEAARDHVASRFAMDDVIEGYVGVLSRLTR